MKYTILAILSLFTLALSACEKPADVASRNLSLAADNFEVARRITFINGITDSYLLTITGLCSMGNFDAARQLSVVCKDGNNYKKYFLGLSDNVTYVTEQLEGVDVSTFHTRVVFRPQTIIPDIDFQGDANELLINRN